MTTRELRSAVVRLFPAVHHTLVIVDDERVVPVALRAYRSLQWGSVSDLYPEHFRVAGIPSSAVFEMTATMTQFDGADRAQFERGLERVRGLAVSLFSVAHRIRKEALALSQRHGVTERALASALRKTLYHRTPTYTLKRIRTYGPLPPCQGFSVVPLDGAVCTAECKAIAAFLERLMALCTWRIMRSDNSVPNCIVVGNGHHRKHFDAMTPEERSTCGGFVDLRVLVARLDSNDLLLVEDICADALHVASSLEDVSRGLFDALSAVNAAVAH